MSNIDKRVLREAAVRAGGMKWQYMRATQHSKAYITDDKGSTVINCTDGDVPAKCAGFLESANPAAVLALLDELEAAESGFPPLTVERLMREKESLEERVAELEAKLAKPVQLPKTNGYWTEQERAFEEAITLAKRQVRLAGFRCEGDE
ncbi:ead/Ea22-like family protein [Enterobacter hormaechei]|uniref:ead/Ea22-like family protein n=1 Tax=Enterobacter hormaechei TaxID=158836 RepID=UPI001D117DEF|nr:ead/Ea22-like family protein [Enterobacter hormaechei]MCC2918858.1 ead/Ea22-like family protein [Enterobacter hormaechei]